jgi:hypothetical protein
MDRFNKILLAVAILEWITVFALTYNVTWRL